MFEPVRVLLQEQNPKIEVGLIVHSRNRVVIRSAIVEYLTADQVIGLHVFQSPDQLLDLAPFFEEYLVGRYHLYVVVDGGDPGHHIFGNDLVDLLRQIVDTLNRYFSFDRVQSTGMLHEKLRPQIEEFLQTDSVAVMVQQSIG